MGGLKKTDADPESLKKGFGMFGEGVVMGVIVGMIIGVVGGYDGKGVMRVGIEMGGVVVLMGRMVGLLMEGVTGMCEGVGCYIEKGLGGKNVYIGL
ncbi:PTS transporter subunit IIC, partial [Bacillus altitudinis]|uniref:PTS transporter subunit IIC n=1 Tax=Bacillus altitudinis TaxID=293387 RepID=UPI00307F3930